MLSIAIIYIFPCTARNNQYCTGSRISIHSSEHHNNIYTENANVCKMYV